MCTSLSYRDAAGRVYFGRTLELTIDLPYDVAFFPVGFETVSQVVGYPALTFAAKHSFLAVTMPCELPVAGKPTPISLLKSLEGLNDKGLTFSLLSYPAASGGPKEAIAATRAVLSASDLGAWALGQFASVAEVTAALAAQPVMLQSLPILGGAVSPFHYVVHDASGASLVIEFEAGEMRLYDNPVGVMTNGPQFSWHLANLNNYTFLSNVDRSAATFGSYKAAQPDSGIATAGLPASNTSVGRFVRAAYYAQFAQKAADPDMAVITLSHVMNNFDRPRGITIDYPSAGSGGLEVPGLSGDAGQSYTTEFTCWTSLADLGRKLFFLRDYRSLSFTRIDLSALSGETHPKVIALGRFDGSHGDGTAALRHANAA